MKWFNFKNWPGVASVVQLFFIEFVILITLGPSIAWVIQSFFSIGNCTPHNVLDFDSVIWMLIGLVGLVWFIFEVLFPRVKNEVYRPFIKFHGIPVPNLAYRPVEYGFLSTHPAYLLIDALGFLIGFAFYDLNRGVQPDIVGCSYLHDYLMGHAFLFLGLFFVIFRFFCWYVLRRRYPATTDLKKCPSWGPVRIFFTIAGIPGLLLISALVYQWVHPEPVTQYPIVNEQALQGGLAEHPEYNGSDDKTYVTVEGQLTDADFKRCGCDQNSLWECTYKAGELLNLGEHLEVLAVNLSNVADFLKVLQNHKAGDTVRFTGKLLPTPNPDNYYDRWLSDQCVTQIYPPNPDKERLYLIQTPLD